MLKTVAALLLLSPAVAVAAPGDELAGNSVEAIRSDGARAAMRFATGGRLHMSAAADGDPFEVDGSYTVAHGRLCLFVDAMGTECWLYPAALTVDTPATLTSVDGALTGTFTLRKGAGAKVPPPAR